MTASLPSLRWPREGPGDAVGRVTLQTIAERVGVSRMTVSNAFSRPDQLSSTLRAKILAAADELGYVGPDPAARALARGTSGAVGILLTDSPKDAFADEVATGFLGAIAEELAPTGLALTLLHSSTRDDVNSARDVAMDGAVIYSCKDHNLAATGWLRRRGLPLVFVDDEPVAGQVNINIDDRGGAEAAAQHLVELGHRRVVLATTGLDSGSEDYGHPQPVASNHVERERFTGWTEALRRGGARWKVISIVSGRDTEAVQDRVRPLLDAPSPPTAVLALSDLAAYGVMRAADDLGIRVPDELSIVGYDDSPLARRLRPALTTVRQDLAVKGRETASALATAITDVRAGGKVHTRHVVLPTELVVRDSTGPATER
jgi:DNA-binding LacI/PurR family transcriptional regulator